MGNVVKTKQYPVKELEAELKRAGDTLWESQEKLQRMLESVTDGISVIDLNGVITEVNQRTVEMHGFNSKDELLGKNAFELVAPGDHEKIATNMRQALKQGALTGMEYTLLKADGSEFPAELSTSALKDASGNLIGHITIARDITERKQAEEALRESQKFSSSLLENSPNPISVINPDTSVRYVNPAFEKLTGFTLAEIAGRKAPYPWWPEGKRKEITAGLKDAMARGGRRSEKNFQKKNGERFWVAVNSAPVVHDGKTIYFLLNWLDITERKRTEEERRELEQKAYLATRLASVGEMASGIAHEINNPLTAVIGFAQLLMEANIPDEIKEDLGIIYEEAQRAAGVAKSLLTFARKHPPVKQLTNINSIIDGMLKLRAYEQRVNNIQVNTQFAPKLPEVMADYSQMEQVFLNIIINAETAMIEANKGGTLSVVTQKVNDTIRASFTDDGPGIAKENLERVFDPFFTTKEVGKGTGLGLSVCHGIVVEHGGRIYARSKLGKGATFVVELPINAH